MCAKYSYREQHTAFGVLPPRIPGLEKLGICDGSTVIEIQASKLGEYEEKGCVMKVLEEYTWTYRNKEIPMLRVKINQYIYKGAGDHYFWFGTDNIGRDQWVRLWRGTRISLLIGFCSVLINCLIGVVYGSISGYYGGHVDMIMQRVTEIIGGRSVPGHGDFVCSVPWRGRIVVYPRSGSDGLDWHEPHDSRAVLPL